MMQKTDLGCEAQATFCSRIELLASWQTDTCTKTGFSGCPVLQRIKERGWTLGCHGNASQPDDAQPQHATLATLP
jgi:hypothetical protein